MSYPNSTDHLSIRNELQLEVTFAEPRHAIVTRPIPSLIGDFAGHPEEVLAVCTHPLEIAGDKLSALMWRVLERGRAAPAKDSTFIRHLHDLAALWPVIEQDKALFSGQAIAAILADDTQNSSARRASASIPVSERLVYLVELLSMPSYRETYTLYVESMSYADDENRMGFEKAHMLLQAITNVVDSY